VAGLGGEKFLHELIGPSTRLLATKTRIKEEVGSEEVLKNRRNKEEN
jgi:hypothetical protein